MAVQDGLASPLPVRWRSAAAAASGPAAAASGPAASCDASPAPTTSHTVTTKAAAAWGR